MIKSIHADSHTELIIPIPHTRSELSDVLTHVCKPWAGLRALRVNILEFWRALFWHSLVAFKDVD